MRRQIREGNKYVKDSKLFAPAGLKDKYAEICNAGSWIDYIIAKIKQDYPSHTSNLEKGTPLNKVRIQKKLAQTHNSTIERPSWESKMSEDRADLEWIPATKWLDILAQGGA
jgi:hypothetical protein